MANHYNPNVSSLAKILSEVFTKPSYDMEDFLDHSYGTMLDAELARKQKSIPTINHEKPSAQMDEGNSIVARLWDL
jgi:U3 small nucleolar RNA-associated protein 19